MRVRMSSARGEATESVLIRAPHELATIPEVARERGVAETTVRRRVWRGLLPAQRVAGIWFILRTDLDSLWPYDEKSR